VEVVLLAMVVEVVEVATVLVVDEVEVEVVVAMVVVVMAVDEVLDDEVVLVLVVDVVVGWSVVDVVVQSVGSHASAQLMNAPQELLGGKASSHFVSLVTWQITSPFFFSLRQSTNPGLPQSDAFSPLVTSVLQALGKPVLPSSCCIAFKTGFQHCL
jgi:hypothetical protein